MQKYELDPRYRELRSAVSEARIGEANRLLSAILGLSLQPDVTLPAITDSAALPADAMASDLSYHGFKVAELAMLAANVKPVVKFEDIPLDQASRFARRYGPHYRLVVGPHYHKDYLLLRSRAPESHASERRDGSTLVCIYASRDDSARKLLELEQRDPANVYDTGTLLGFPRCCIEAFAADHVRSRSDQDTLNDEACRRLAATATSDHPGHPALNPLSNHELLGFYACHMQCEAAIAYAHRNIRALARVRPQELAEVRRQLQRPCLFWRLPFFINFDGEVRGDTVFYRGATVNRFPDPAVHHIQRLFAAHLMPSILAGDRLTVGDDYVEVRRGEQVLQRWHVEGETPPILMAMAPWPAEWTALFDSAEREAAEQAAVPVAVASSAAG